MRSGLKAARRSQSSRWLSYICQASTEAAEAFASPCDIPNQSMCNWSLMEGKSGPLVGFWAPAEAIVAQLIHCNLLLPPLLGIVASYVAPLTVEQAKAYILPQWGVGLGRGYNGDDYIRSCAQDNERELIRIAYRLMAVQNYDSIQPLRQLFLCEQGTKRRRVWVVDETTFTVTDAWAPEGVSRSKRHFKNGLPHLMLKRATLPLFSSVPCSQIFVPIRRKNRK